MAGSRQLRLLLWKDYLIRKRKFITLAGIIWASGIMFAFYIVRQNVDNQDFPTCQFPARALPSAGMMPFLQSFICSISNECSPMDQFEEIPAYEKAKFTRMSRKMSPLLNDSVLELASSMPDAVKLLATLANAADEPTFQDFSKYGLKVKDLFIDSLRVKRYVMSHLDLDDDTAQSLMMADISFQGLMKGNITRCSADSLSQALVVEDSEHLDSITNKLCSLSTKDMQKILMDIIFEVNFSKYIKMLGNMYYKISGDDRITKLGDFLTALLRMTNLQHFLPPEITRLFFGKQIDFSYLDLNMIKKFVEQFQPTFGDTKEYQSIKEFADIAVMGVQYLDKIFGNTSNNDATEEVRDLMDRNIGDNIDAKKEFDKLSKVFSRAVNSIENMEDKKINIDPYDVLTQLTKLIHKFLPNDKKHDVLFYATLLSKLMESGHQVIKINMHIEEITYNVTLRNPQAIKILKNVPPYIVGKAFEALVSAERTQIVTSKLNFPGQMFCDLSKLQNFFLISKTEADSIKTLFCTDTWKNYMNDMIKSFGVFDVKDNINSMASLLIQETMGKDTSSQLYSLEKDFQILKNFTSALVTMESEKKPVFDWIQFLGEKDDSELLKTVKEKSHLGKLILISVHGAFAKEIIKQNAILQYKITPTLLDATTLITALNDQLEATPPFVPEGVKSVYGDIVMTLLLTALNEEKAYRSLSAYCEDIFCNGGENATSYLEFPNDADIDNLSSVLCNASKVIEEGLRNDSLVSRSIHKIRNTTHTLLEEINWTRLISNIQKLYVKLAKDYPYIFEFSSYSMDNVTQEKSHKLFKNAKDYWFSIKNLQRGLHLSVKLGFRMLDFLDHGIFNMTNEHWLKMKYVMSSSVGPLTVVDNSIKLLTGLLTNSSHTSDLPPITVNSVSRIVSNLPHLMVDSINIVVNDNTDTQPIISLLNTSPAWPCSNTSLSELLDLTTSSQDAVLALETLLCMDKDLQKEWNVYLDEKKAKINKSMSWNNTDFEPHIFLKFSSTFDDLIKDATLVKDALKYIINDDDTEDHMSLKTALDYTLQLMNNSERNVLLKNFFHKLDIVLNNVSSSAVHGNMSINNIWEAVIKCSNGSYIDGDCRATGRDALQHTLKMLSVIFDNFAIDLTTYFTEVNDPEANLLQVLGFTKSTALYMLYDRLPEFVGVLVNSYWDFGFMSQVRRASYTRFWDCDAVVSALVPAPESSIQLADINRVKPYLCPSFINWISLPRGDNVLFNLVAKPQYFFFSMPVQNATSSFEGAFTKATDLSKYLSSLTKENKTDITNELKLQNVENKLKQFIDKVLSYKIDVNNEQYIQFSDVVKKQLFSNMYLTRVVAMVNKLALNINNISIEEQNDLNEDEIQKLNSELKIVRNIFKRKSVDAIAIYYDVFTDILWTNDDNYTLIQAMDDMCSNLKNNDIKKTILVDEVRVKLQLCAKNYKYIFGLVQNTIEDDYQEARQSLLDLIPIFSNGDDNNVTDIFEFLNSREQQINSLKHSIKYSYDMGLQIYLKYLQSYLKNYKVILAFLSGENWWKELREFNNGPYAEKFFGYLENSFEIADNVLNNLDGIHLVRLIHDLDLNDTTSFCRPNITLSDYVPDSTRSLSELKEEICTTDYVALFKEIPPLLFASQGYESNMEIPKDIDFNELNEDISITRSKLELIIDGPAEPRRPLWVTEDKLNILRKNVVGLLSKETMTKMAFGMISNAVDAGTLFLDNGQCTYCSQMTTWFKQLNLQLFKKQEYDTLLCHLHNMNLDDIYRTLKNDFHWDMLISELMSTRNYTKYELNKSMTEFLGLVKAHLLEDITAPTTKLTECLGKNVSRNEFGNASLFLSILSRTAKLLQAETGHLQEVPGVKNLTFFNQLFSDVAHNLDVFRPLKGYTTRSTEKELSSIIADDEIVMDIEDSDINLKMVKNNMHLEDMLRLHTNSWENICEDHNCSAVAAVIISSLNLTKIERDLPSLQNAEFWRFSFVKSILRRVEGLLSHAARVAGVASAVDVKGAMGGKLEAVLDLVLKIFMDETFDRIIYSLYGLIKELRPLLKGTILEKDLEAIASGLKIFFQFKTYLVEEEDLKLQVSTLFRDPDAVEYGLTALGINDTNFWSLAAPRIQAGYIHFKPVLSSKEPTYHISSFVCSVDAMAGVVRPAALGAVSAAAVLAATAAQFCALSDHTAKQLLPVLAANMHKDLIVDKIKDHLLSKLYSASDLTADEGSRVLERFPRMAALLPLLQNDVGDIMQEFNEEPLFQSLQNFSSVGNLMGSSDFLSNAGNMLCGKPFQTTTSRMIKSIISAQDMSTQVDQAQLDVLPTDFCRSMYQDIISMEGGKIMWSFVKPLIRGKILYTPRHPTVDKIIAKANSTFASMVSMANLVHSFSTAFPSLDSISSHREGLHALQRMMTAPGMDSIRNMLLGDQELNIQVDVEGMLEKVGDLKGIGSLLSKASDLLHCVNLNRFQAVPGEHELMMEAAKLLRVNEFSAGIVFLNVDKLDNSLANVEYKIRMDIENAPTTKWMKPYLWTPGPDASFIENMRYFRGFVQIQDILDRAIIQLSKEGSRTKREVVETDWAIYTQQEPYPCYRKDFFQSSLYESQSLIVAFFFSLVFTVVSAVRFILADKESGNTLLMSVMGVNLTYHTLSWFLASLVEMVVTLAVITAILKWCAVLPHTDPTLVFALVLVFGLSVLSFCYLMSKLFKSASSGAVCAGVAYMVSFMPFVLIISLEAVMVSELKLLVCLSMSSSLCYAFLYVARYEAMGVGARWSDAWSSPNDDSMSIAAAALMIAFDALLYLAIGYFIDKYFGIKSIQTSISNSTSRDEKAGVSVLNVSKVYGERSRNPKIALDNVSIELCKGQITGLLGHNGAGKTTLINILTGMLKPSKGSIIIRSEPEGTRLGVCPQKDVLFEYMTAREHIALYAQLKSGLSEEQVKDEVDRMLRVLSLGDVSETAVRALSGGTRRRVCVALAFVARPTLVVLDEPTAGVDPAARRDIWSMIAKLKEDRTILLTTHHLDEAELLSDQIVIMHKGQIHTTGSPIEIKRALGNGYKLSVMLPGRHANDWEYSVEEKTKQLLALIRDVVKNASIADVSNGQVEINLPFYDGDGANNNFLEVCTVLEQNQVTLGYRSFSLDCSSLEQVFFEICARADSQHSELAEELPPKSVSSSSIVSDRGPLVVAGGARRGTRTRQFRALFRARYLHHIRNKWLLFMLVGLPSLFVTIAMAFATIRPPADNEVALHLNMDLYSPSTHYLVPNPSLHSDYIDPTFAQRVMGQVKSTRKSKKWTNKDTPTCECTLTRQECKIDKNMTKSLPEMMVLPDVSTLNTWLVNSHDIFIEKRYGGFTSNIKNNKTNLIAWYNNKGYHAMPSYLNALNNAILRTVAGNDRRIIAYSHPMKISKEQISKNTVYQHVADAGISALVLIAFSLVSAGAAIYLVSSRLRQEKRLQLLCGVTPALYWSTQLAWDMMIIAVNMVITAIVMRAFGFPVFVARNNLIAICVLFLLYGFACANLIHCMEKLFQDPSLANMLLFCGNTFMGLAGLVLLLILDIISESDATDNARWALHKLFLLSPQFALGDGLLEIAKNTIQAEVLYRFGMDTYRDPISSDLILLHYSCQIVVGVVLMMLNLAIEYGYFQWIQDRFVSASVYAQLGERITSEPEDVAAERKRVAAAIAESSHPPLSVSTIGNINRGFVHTEGKNNSLQRSVSAGGAAAACRALGKAFGARLAVRALSLSVPPGQCTALLGENGAGKSTTFAMLTGECRPTRGEVYLAGKRRDPRGLARGLISYCPQSDAIDPLLTVKETLELYCNLRGIDDVEQVVDGAVRQFALQRWASAAGGALSGGNRRKLCAALAFTARAPLVLLDEPTSGMDPVSRGVVWAGVAGACAAARGVLLSTHALGDARRAAHSVALLRRGELAALAATHDCLTRFGGGWVVSARARGGRGARGAWRAVRRAARGAARGGAGDGGRGAQLRVLHAHDLQFLLPAATTVDNKEKTTLLSDIFRMMAQLQASGDIEDFTVNQSSLEQMFLSFSDDTSVNIDDVDLETLSTPETIRRGSHQLDSVTSL